MAGLKEYALRSLKSLENLLFLVVEGFGDLPNLPFSEEWVTRINIPKKKSTENGIDLKECTQNSSWPAGSRHSPLRLQQLRKYKCSSSLTHTALPARWDMGSG